jgi:NAD dependent epimerase/dehydratase family enzyme
VARRWEDAFYASTTPATRRIALRSSMTMSPDAGGVFSVLLGLVRAGLGGTQGGGQQFVSWIHDRDYCRAVDFLIAHQQIAGPVNLTAPNPLPNRDFLRDLRRAARMPVGLPAAAWMLEIGAFFLRTETELILKSRKAVPTVLLRNGFTFDFPRWPDAAADLVARSRGAAREQQIPSE